MPRGVYVRTKPPWNKGKHIKSNNALKIWRKKIGGNGRLGCKHTEETKQKMRLAHPNGNKSRTWKGGKYSENGYILIYSPNHPFVNSHGYVLEHRLVMEAHLGRYLKPTEHVHHIDWDRSNNSIENLYLFNTQGEHQKYHWFLRRIVKEELEA
jgi:hypothetical protein